MVNDIVGGAPRQTTGRRVFFTAIAVVFALLVGEAAVRLVHSLAGADLTGSPKPPTDQVEFSSPVSVLDLEHFIPDPLLIWRNRPNSIYRYGATINAKGFRGADFAIPKPAGTYRIICLGDSTTYGFILPDGSTFPDILSDILLQRRSHVKFEVINAGVPGYSSYQGMRLFLNEVASWQADTVIVSFGFDDHLWAGGPPDKNIPRGSGFMAAAQSLLGRSALFLFMRRLMAGTGSAEADPEHPTRRVSLDDFDSNLARIVQAAQNSGAIPYLLTQPINLNKPLVINPIRRVVEGFDGKKRVVFEMHRFVAGQDTIYLYQFDGDPALLMETIRLHPDWPMPHYLLGMYYAKQGQKELAMRKLRQARELDHDRRVVSGYNDVARRVAARQNVSLIDLSREFEQYRYETLFRDDVHFNAEGAKKAAEIIATYLK